MRYEHNKPLEKIVGEAFRLAFGKKPSRLYCVGWEMVEEWKDPVTRAPLGRTTHQWECRAGMGAGPLVLVVRDATENLHAPGYKVSVGMELPETSLPIVVNLNGEAWWPAVKGLNTDGWQVEAIANAMTGAVRKIGPLAKAAEGLAWYKERLGGK